MVHFILLEFNYLQKYFSKYAYKKLCGIYGWQARHIYIYFSPPLLLIDVIWLLLIIVLNILPMLNRVYLAQVHLVFR